MRENIGNIKMDYTFYSGKDIYSDGQVEDELLDIVMKGNVLEALRLSTSWPILYHLSDIRENLLEWYPFRKNSKILEVGSGCGALTGLLSRKAESVTCIELSKKRSLINAYKNAECENVIVYVGNFKDIEPNLQEQYDYITLIGVWEYSANYLDACDPYLYMLKIAKKHLKDDGKIIIAIENKMGLKYWNGAVEDHTGCIGSGLNDYSNKENIRTFSKMEIDALLKKAGIISYKMYYPVPDYKLPDAIYSESIQPVLGSIRDYGKNYDVPRLYYFNDAILSDQICRDNMFTYFSNSFLLITGEEDEECLFQKYARCRKEKFQIRTEIIQNGKKKFVKKKALCKKAEKHILNIKENELKWANELPNIHCIEGHLYNNTYIMPYISGQNLDGLFYEHRYNSSMFIEQFQYYIKKYLMPKDEKLIPFEISLKFIQIFGKDYPNRKQSLRYTNLDLIFSNLRLSEDGVLYSFDYEWCFDFPIPYEYVIWRAAWNLYKEYKAYLSGILCEKAFLEAIGISEKDASIYMNMEKNFSKYVFGEAGKENYLSKYKKNIMTQNFTFK